MILEVHAATRARQERTALRLFVLVEDNGLLILALGLLVQWQASKQWPVRPTNTSISIYHQTFSSKLLWRDIYSEFIC